MYNKMALLNELTRQCKEAESKLFFKCLDKLFAPYQFAVKTIQLKASFIDTYVAYENKPELFLVETDIDFFQVDVDLSRTKFVLEKNCYRFLNYNKDFYPLYLLKDALVELSVKDIGFVMKAEHSHNPPAKKDVKTKAFLSMEHLYSFCIDKLQPLVRPKVVPFSKAKR